MQEKLFGLFIVVFLGLTVSSQPLSRWVDEKDQIRTEEESKDTGREMFRVYRGDHFYVTDHRGADILRSGVNEGYRQGFSRANAIIWFAITRGIGILKRSRPRRSVTNNL